jgi:hypothetical protein
MMSHKCSTIGINTTYFLHDFMYGTYNVEAMGACYCDKHYLVMHEPQTFRGQCIF